MSETSIPHVSERDAEQLGISPNLLAMLVCPVDHAALRKAGDDLVCTQCGRAYAVREGIPSMVVDQATT
jgi:uncharacterized protein YbaR (Trm112 family)